MIYERASALFFIAYLPLSPADAPVSTVRPFRTHLRKHAGYYDQRCGSRRLCGKAGAVYEAGRKI